MPEHYASAYDDGLERAALHLQRKADQMRKDSPTPTADMMARIFETEADEILALRKSVQREVMEELARADADLL